MVGLVRILSLLLLAAFAVGTSVQAAQYAAMGRPVLPAHAAMTMHDLDMGGELPAPCKPCQTGFGHNSASCDGYCVPQVMAGSWVSIDLPTFQLSVLAFALPAIRDGVARAPSLPPPRTI